MNIKNEPSIRILFSALQEKARDSGARQSIYDSLTVLIDDLDRFFDVNAINAHYMKEKTGLFKEACREVAGIERPTNTVAASTTYADNLLAVIKSMPQWKTAE